MFDGLKRLRLKILFNHLWSAVYMLPPLLFRERYAYTEEIKGLLRDGFHLSQQKLLTTEQCAQLRDRIDEYIVSDKVDVWTDPSGAENRIYFINHLDKEFADLFELSYLRDILKGYLGISKPVGMLQARKICINQPHLAGDIHWHRDSVFFRQLKVACNLNNPGDAPTLQIIRGSHQLGDVLKAVWHRVFKPFQTRFSNSEIDGYLKNSQNELVEFGGKPGQVFFIDSKAIHRSYPVTYDRYVLVWHFWPKSIPDQYSALN